jgi:anion-transporting  ArsA/GET3 family ATPase
MALNATISEGLKTGVIQEEPRAQIPYIPLGSIKAIADDASNQARIVSELTDERAAKLAKNAGNIRLKESVIKEHAIQITNDYGARIAEAYNALNETADNIEQQRRHHSVEAARARALFSDDEVINATLRMSHAQRVAKLDKVALNDYAMQAVGQNSLALASVVSEEAASRNRLAKTDANFLDHAERAAIEKTLSRIVAHESTAALTAIDEIALHRATARAQITRRPIDKIRVGLQAMNSSGEANA